MITDADVDQALTQTCGLCKQPPGSACINPCDGEALPGRTVHYFRIEPK